MTVDEAIALVPNDWYWEVALGVPGSEDSKCGPGPYWATLYPKDPAIRIYLRDKGILDWEFEILVGAETPADALAQAAQKARDAR